MALPSGSAILLFIAPYGEAARSGHNGGVPQFCWALRRTLRPGMLRLQSQGGPPVDARAAEPVHLPRQASANTNARGASVAAIATRRGNLCEGVKVHLRDSLERFAGRGLAEAFRQGLEPFGITQR